MEKKYHICHKGEEAQGPYSLNELKTMKLYESTLVWREGFEKWIPIRNVKELSELWDSLIQTPLIPPAVDMGRNITQQEMNNPIEYTEVNKKHGVPAIISFFLPGVGQLIKGHIGKAFLVWILLIIAFVMLVSGGVLVQQGDDSKALLGLLGLIGLPVIFFWNIYDAYNSN